VEVEPQNKNNNMTKKFPNRSKTLINGSILWLLLLTTFNVSAAEFPWFKVRDSYQGFVEFIEGNQTTRTIYILPVLGVPGTAFYQDKPWGFSPPNSNTGIEIDENGDLFLNFKIHTNNDHLPDDFKQEVINHITGKGFNTSKYKTLTTQNYIVNFIKPQNIKVSLFLENQLYETKDYNGILDGNFKDKFKITSNKLNALRLGNFDLKIEYDFPYQKFSSLSINISEQLVTKVKIDVFKELIQQSSSSSGGFLFWKWKEKTHRVIERNRINFDASNNSTSDISIVYRDATPEMVERINTVLGFYTLTKKDLLEKHNAAYNAAMGTNLGDLHKKYHDAVEADDVSKSIDILKAAAALSEGDLFTFLASGVAFSDNSSYGYSSFHGIKRVNISSSSNSTYNEIMTNTVLAKFNGIAFKPSTLKDAINDGYRQKNAVIFNNPSYLPLYTSNWVNPFFQAVINKDIKTTKYLTTYFTPIAQVNSLWGNNSNTALHIASQNGDYEMVKELLNFGINPSIKNRYNETAEMIAIEKGYIEIANLIKSKENLKGAIEIEINLPMGYKLDAVSYSPLDYPYAQYINNNVQWIDNRDKFQTFTSNKVTVKYFPGLYPIFLTIFYTDPYGRKNMADISRIYKIKNSSIIKYTENLTVSPITQILTNDSKIYIGTMIDPIYIDY